MINLALIGAGRWGRNYLKAIGKIRNAEIKYVCSGTSSLRSLSAEYVKVDNYRNLAEKDDVGGIIIATPAAKHFEIAEFFLKKNVPILIEKPLVISLYQAKKLRIIFEQTDGWVLVGNIFLYNPAFQKFVSVAEKMDNIQYLNFEGCDYGPIRNDVSALWDWAQHDISMCLELLKENPISVSAWGTNTLHSGKILHDMVYARLLFKNGIQAFLRMGWLSPVKKREVLIVGQRKSLLFDDLSHNKITHFDKSLKKTNIEYDSDEPLIKELEDFIKMIDERKTPLSDFKKSFAVVTVMDALERSIERNGAMVKIEG